MVVQACDDKLEDISCGFLWLILTMTIKVSAAFFVRKIWLK
ncbi:hypothetical protein PB1A_0497 [Leuconostoc inhae]|uniref:Uncharacterized protein n=1 Tax=Leuconostoc inhae TaxID=178001 RepID=A0AAN2UGA9_9LACO|nr:hypothetical protein LEGAS_1074 [Leuconostoc gasicomitatum LMG 18811]CUR63689.1 Uncharacterized protein LEKG_1102 [Leuconostoc gasicomitatum KG16-1]CUW04987.1 hypothetical protein C120C_0565 [Leuconostoc inhae]CUW09204.1 hypothetical protein PB1A_0497 [Leuconostoc inhae]CUW11556.1 hypothetical protein PL111_0250 [Leuconostoc inhae]